MANKTLTATVDLDTKKGIKAAQDLQKQVVETGTAIEDLRTPGKIAADAIAAMSVKMQQELEEDGAAADELRAALERIGADTTDVDEYVGQLRKVGLTADDIRADVDTLADAIKQMEDVAKTAGAGADDGIRKVGTAADDTKGKVRAIGDTADQSGSVLANAMGNSVQDVAALGGVAGTAGMALGQIAEYATEGNISMKELAKVAGPMLAVTAASMALAAGVEAIGAKAGVTAKKTAEVSAEMTDLLGIMDKLRDAAGGNAEEFASLGQAFTASIVNKMEDKELVRVYEALGNVGKTGAELGRILIDIERDSQGAMAQLARDAGVPDEMADAFARAIDSTEKWTAARGKLINDGWSIAQVDQYAAVGKSLEELNDQQQNYDVETVAAQQLALAAGTDAATAALVNQATATATAKDENATASAVLDEFIRLQGEEKTAAELAAEAEAKAAQASRDLALASKEAAQAAAAHRYEHDALKQSLSDESSWLSLQDQFDAYEQALRDADAAVQSGSITAEQGERRKQQALVETKQKVADYATEVLGLPPEMVTAILADIDNGSVADAETTLDNLTKGRTIPVKIQVINPGSGGFYAGGGTVPGAMGGYSKVTTSEFGAEDIYVPNGSKVRTASQTIQDGQGGGGGPVYNLYVTAGLGTDPRAVGRELIGVIREYERLNGPGWRSEGP